MQSFHEWYNQHKNNCTCGREHEPLPTEVFEIGSGILEKLPPFLNKKQLSRPHVVYDKHTKKAAGEAVETLLDKAGINYTVSLVPENEQEDVLADEHAIMHVLVEAPAEADCMIAVGAGTLHDITRFASYKMGIPFLSVPTAPSVDGFNSKGAPIVMNKVKKTYQTQAPIGLFAEIDILVEAPQAMVAAGFADMLGKYTSLADWKFSRLTADEPFCDASYHMTKEALENCVNHAEKIAVRDAAGMEYLIAALIQSGMAMSLFGHSHPASAAEHHLSHFWEMKFLKEDRKQLLHGEKVGAACGIIAEHYHNNKQWIIDNSPAKEQNSVADILEEIPSGEEVRRILKLVGGKTTAEELGIAQSWVEEGLQEAHHIRDRHTMLRLLNEQKRASNT
ncbi:sn-glycerol-1-phosphate dehydrogenase [Alkalicoccus daliensis]|uniref:Glycerol-1-phosphate dehydrogenase [NAD(P)+] n=1 Tax=Alkalicoccus daliensis TaxID=745820 RepID=A0A1H0FWB4_9BACI|nr:sn-glycerol-1-phosphate dehydrogenase [Alkalicoccus daliensis]SDN98946.1 glycerol-1-phosphate dehydrogenase [NAD(P)+] [Alkalicoccus daliensis]